MSSPAATGLSGRAAASAAARPDAIRRHNLSLILGHVHRDGALTRAELTQRLGVSRSTIGTLVSDLTALGLVEESVPSGGDRVGRPSHVVGPHSSGPFAVAADVDVRHISCSGIGINGEVLSRRTVATGPGPLTPEDVADLLADCTLELARETGRPVIGVGVSVPGTVEQRTTVGIAPNLGWRDAPLGDLLRDRLQSRLAADRTGVSADAPDPCPVSVGNDADLSLLAELNRGRATGCQDVVYLIGRVGVGAGVVANGAPVRGRDGRAGEIGHNVVDTNGPECHCGKHGCLETIIGDAALLALAGREGPPTVENVATVFDAARAGEDRALAAVRSAAGWLGQALGTLVNLLNPQRVILGGSLAGVLELARPEVEHALKQYAFDPGHPVELVTPRFGSDAALLGAAELAFAALLEDPYAARPRALR